MFQFLKKKQVEKPEVQMTSLAEEPGKEIICAPIEGEAVASAEISDITFQQEMLGKGMAIKPVVGKVFAPVDGKVEMLIDSMHAFSMTSDSGTEILIHVGIDTVELKGKYFKRFVKEGARVKRGDLIIEFDLQAVQEAGYDVISPIIICNSDEYAEVERVTGKMVRVGETIMKLKK